MIQMYVQVKQKETIENSLNIKFEVHWRLVQTSSSSHLGHFFAPSQLFKTLSAYLCPAKLLIWLRRKIQVPPHLWQNSMQARIA